MSRSQILTRRLQELLPLPEPVKPSKGTPGNGKAAGHEPLLPQFDPKLNAAPPHTTEEIESSTAPITAPISSRVGWEDYLDAIRRSEQMTVSYQSEESHPGGNGHGSGAVFTAPLQAGENELGVIEVQTDADHPLGEQAVGLVASVAQQMMLHLENLRLLEQADQYRQEAEAAVRRITRQGWQEFAETRSTPIQGFTYDHDRVQPFENNLTDTHSATSSQPIRVRDETIGELVIESTGAPAPADLVSAVADRLGTHIESLRLLEETEQSRQQLDRRAAELETVARVSTTAASTLDPQTLLQSVVDLTQQNFNLYHAQVYLMSNKGDSLVLGAGSGKIGVALQIEKPVIAMSNGSSTLIKVTRSRSGLIINDTRLEPEYHHYPFLPDTLSELAVPMIVGEDVVGVFSVLSSSANRFMSDEMRTYTTLAAQTAVALRNAELYAEQMATVERLRELDQLKSSFLANMSHELRTPLNSILGFSQVILEGIDGPITDIMTNDMQLIEKNGRHLLNLITDILDMAKIEAGRLALNFEPFNLRDLVADVFETTQPLTREKALYLNLELDPQVDYTIKADLFRMRQIFINLVGNAIKFTLKGGITVRAERSADAIRIGIHDTGIGIPPEKLDTIFEAFSQVDTSTTRKVGGTGLGLPISRQLVELHGGKLWAESTGIAGEGSTFWIELPINPTPLPILPAGDTL